MSNFALVLNRRARRGASIADAVACLLATLVLILIVLSETQRHREMARAIRCRENLRHIGIAITNYHRTHQQLPTQGSGTHNPVSADASLGDAGQNGVGGNGGGNNGLTLSFLVGILPQLEQADLWADISAPSVETVSGTLSPGSSWNPMGPSCQQREYKPWVTDLPTYACPSDPRKGITITGRSNYAACLGDSADYQMDSEFRFDKEKGRWGNDQKARKRIDASARGAFVYRQRMTFDDITDGLSMTILVGEIATHLGDLDKRTTTALGFGQQSDTVPARGGILDEGWTGMEQIDIERPRFWDRSRVRLVKNLDENRGLRWADARTVFTGFTTISPPNTQLTVQGDSAGGSAIAPASSHHHGGAHFLLADGSTTFLLESIDSGDMYSGCVRLGMEGALSPGSPSPYGPWGALGTRASND